MKINGRILLYGPLILFLIFLSINIYKDLSENLKNNILVLITIIYVVLNILGFFGEISNINDFKDLYNNKNYNFFKTYDDFPLIVKISRYISISSIIIGIIYSLDHNFFSKINIKI